MQCEQLVQFCDEEALRLTVKHRLQRT